jgi:hypothetical protein
MSVKDLVYNWEKHASGAVTEATYEVRLPLEDAAKIAALEEMYPSRTQEQIITELLTAALDELENGFPYKQGSKIVTTDEMGDPVYEDEGLTPQFLELSRKHYAHLKQDQKS